MVGSWGLKRFAFPAPALPRVPATRISRVCPPSGCRGGSPVLWHTAWARKACSQVANPQTKYEQIELDDLPTGERLRLEGEKQHLRRISKEDYQKRDCRHGEPGDAGCVHWDSSAYARGKVIKGEAWEQAARIDYELLARWH